MRPDQAIRLERPGSFVTVSDPLHAPQAYEARLRIRRVGVCGTDIHAYHGRQPFFSYPRILGHELAGEVLSAPTGSGLKTGDLVAVEPYLNDPLSPASGKAKPNCCEQLQVLGVHCDGGMRTELNVPVRKLHLASSLSLDQMASVEMLGIGYHAVGRSAAVGTDCALILGTGPIGLSVLTFLRSRVERVVVADLSRKRLDFCRDALGAVHTLHLSHDMDEVSLLHALRETCGGGLPDLVFDATGSRASMERTFQLVAHGGTIVLVGLTTEPLTLDDANFHRREITLKASRNATTTEFRAVIDAIASGKAEADSWISHRMNLDEVPGRFAAMVGDPGLRKAIIEIP
jgi:2-desacetyl-2-hydroxyethyl bacteriochlorophyllide A dehydrogenase